MLSGLRLRQPKIKSLAWGEIASWGDGVVKLVKLSVEAWRALSSCVSSANQFAGSLGLTAVETVVWVHGFDWLDLAACTCRWSLVCVKGALDCGCLVEKLPEFLRGMLLATVGVVDCRLLQQ